MVVEDEQEVEGPGLYDRTNHDALKKFMAKYPDTEQALVAEVLLLAAQPTPSSDTTAAAEQAQRLKDIATKTQSAGTAKMAKLLRIGCFFCVKDDSGFKQQADEIFAQVNDYKSERDKYFLFFCKVVEGCAPQEIEPMLRELAITVECGQHNVTKALLMAEDLRQKFPRYDQRGVNSLINGLKKGEIRWGR